MPHPFYNFFVGLAGSGLAQGGPGAKESALAPELELSRAVASLPVSHKRCAPANPGIWGGEGGGGVWLGCLIQIKKNILSFSSHVFCTIEKCVLSL